MYHPTTRVLAVLEMLQARGRMTGAELAGRLEVNVRTARRYIETLQDLGIPIEAERGRYGAYRLRPGFRLPPLMLTEDEALAVVLGLLAARRLALGAATPAVEATLAKLGRVLPERLREQVQAVEAALVLDFRRGDVAPPAPAVVVTLSLAVHASRRVQLRYRSAREDETERAFDPYGLVCHEGAWYLPGHCHLRGDRRLLRLDRVLEVELRDERFIRPPNFAPLREVIRMLADRPGHWRFEVLLETTLPAAQQAISPLAGLLDETPEGVLFHGSTADLDWFAQYVAGRGFPLVVRQPAELRAALRRHAETIAAYAERGEA